MKKLLYFVTFLGALILFTACSKDQDIYRPKQKLYKIWELSEVGDPDQTFIYDKRQNRKDEFLTDEFSSLLL